MQSYELIIKVITFVFIEKLKSNTNDENAKFYY